MIRARVKTRKSAPLLHSRQLTALALPGTHMFGRFLPKEGRFFDLFNQHSEQIVRAAHELAALMQDYEDRERYARAIDEAEHAADRITAETVRLLHKSFITPLDRDHIHQLVTAMDDICDLIQDTTESLTLFDVRRITPETV